MKAGWTVRHSINGPGMSGDATRDDAFYFCNSSIVAVTAFSECHDIRHCNTRLDYLIEVSGAFLETR